MLSVIVDDPSSGRKSWSRSNMYYGPSSLNRTIIGIEFDVYYAVRGVFIIIIIYCIPGTASIL